MPRLTILYTILFLFFPVCLFSQPINTVTDFSSVDSAARTVKYKNDISQLTNDLVKPYSRPLFQVRAIFIWITENIRYDYKFMNKGKEIKIPDCKPGIDCGQMLIEWENNYLKQVIRQGKAVCDGYARLFRKMCDIAGIRSSVISGYTKTKPYQVGVAGPVNHAWNAVWVDSAYHFVDATWAAGYCEEDESTGKLLNFQKRYDNYYWFTPFHDLARNHYPKEGRWVFEPNYTKEKFANNPWISPDIISDIRLVTPGTGVIHVKKGDTIHFKFTYTGIIEILQINSNIFRNPAITKEEKVSRRRSKMVTDTLALKKQRYIPFIKSGDTYEFDHIVTDNSLYYLEILLHYRRIMRFKIIVAKEN